MILNLFSIFDPQTLILINWISSFLGLYIIPQFFWFLISRISFLFNKLIIILWNEFSILIKYKFNTNNLIYFIVLFIFITFNNFLGLFPYIFTRSSHLIFPIIFALSIWIGLIIFGWLNNFKFILIHLVPQNTPFILIFFIVLIELLRNIIRPLTLSIRLTANIIAGHLLLTLLAIFINKNFFVYNILRQTQRILIHLEIAVSFIQAYVFVILIILYLKETN